MASVAAMARKGVGGATPLEGCSCVENGECVKQTGAVSTICRRRRGGGGQREDPTPWLDANKAWLVALKKAHIEMADTLYGRFLAAQKRDAERAFQHMNATEREAFLRRLTEINAANAKDGQSPPPNPTPI